MFSTKNLSPRQLAAFTALALSVPAAIAALLVRPLWWIGLLALLMVFVVSYLLFLYTLQRFIYRKIKLIYKFIYQTKASRREEFYYKNILPQKSIDEVRADVESWAEQRSREIETLQQNEQYRKEFLQNLSHELKTPIFSIQSYVETLINGAAEKPDIRDKFLQSTANNVERLTRLVDDLDAISKLESGEQLLVQENFVIQDICRDVFEALLIRAEQRGISLQIKKGCEQPVSVFADKEKIRQVIINLVDNAIKYGKEQGAVEASFYRLDGEKVLVEISDDGDGIPEEHLSRIFERFYRTDLARSRKVGGSGLGLAICKHIIEAHGEAMHVRSTPAIGTTFGFTLQHRRDEN